MSKKLQIDESKVIDLYLNQSMTTIQISKILNVSSGSIFNILKRNKIKRIFFTENDKNQIIESKER